MQNLDRPIFVYLFLNLLNPHFAWKLQRSMIRELKKCTTTGAGGADCTKGGVQKTKSKSLMASVDFADRFLGIKNGKSLLAV